MTEWDVLKTKDTQTVMSKDSSYKKRKKAPKKGGGYGIFQLCAGDYVEAHQMLDVLPASPAKEKSFIWKMI